MDIPLSQLHIETMPLNDFKTINNSKEKNIFLNDVLMERFGGEDTPSLLRLQKFEIIDEEVYFFFQWREY